MIGDKRRTEFANQVASVSTELQDTAKAGKAAFVAISVVAIVALLVASAALLRASR